MFAPIGDAGRAELVEQRIADAIMGGLLRAGARLPSEADLARTMGVAPTTVREALTSLRQRQLVVTRRGRNGGSFVSENADPLTFARADLGGMSRLALHDLGAHYAALTLTAMRLAARRAAPSEIDAIGARLQRLIPLMEDEPDPRGLTVWRQSMDDLLLELVALSQSARLTRNQMRLQAELSPMLRLLDADRGGRTMQRDHLVRIVDAVGAGDPASATDRTELMVADVIAALELLRRTLGEA